MAFLSGNEQDFGYSTRVQDYLKYPEVWSYSIQIKNVLKWVINETRVVQNCSVQSENPSCQCEFRFLLVPRKLKWSEYCGKTFTTSFKIALACHEICYHWVLTYRGASRAGWLPLRRVTDWNWMFELLLLTDSWLLREAGWILCDRT
jgi:hypothetical protein